MRYSRSHCFTSSPSDAVVRVSVRLRNHKKLIWRSDEEYSNGGGSGFGAVEFM